MAPGVKVPLRFAPVIEGVRPGAVPLGAEIVTFVPFNGIIDVLSDVGIVGV